MAKRTTLTAAAVEKLKPGKERREVADAGAPGLRLVIQPSPSGSKSWAMRFRRPNGKSAKLTLGPLDLSGKEAADEPKIGDPLTLAAARALAADISRQRQRSLDVVAEHKTAKQRRRIEVQERSSNTFAGAAQDFIKGHKVRKSGAKPRRWRETARLLGFAYPMDGGDPTFIKGGLAKRWGDKPIADIDAHDIYSTIDEARHKGVPGLERRNEGVSDARGRKMADALSVMFGWLHDHRKITANPTLGSYRPPPPAARKRVLNVKMDVRRADELRWFWAACEGDEIGEKFGAVFRLLLLTGCRLNEIARATRDELSDDSATLRLPGSRTKNRLPYDVPLPPLAREILKHAKRQTNSEFLFSTTGHSPISGFSKIKKRLDEAMAAEAAKEGGKFVSWRLHDLRRTCATGMAGLKVPPHIVEACLNHISGAKSGVAGTYNVEEYMEEKRAALERWASHVAGVISGKRAKVIPMRRPVSRGRK
ncbi:site-specific integrase [Bradyrhizobium sp. th.b2]|uniref:tyrosine-type recombinase/integrase n=1 Tax=Bradyrhizobium sp. th-b2 TaxID=172088 RepID=UPI000427197A|nr:site-specific integrase [Bradyrhizobium sp. th.b2]